MIRLLGRRPLRNCPLDAVRRQALIHPPEDELGPALRYIRPVTDPRTAQGRRQWRDCAATSARSSRGVMFAGARPARGAILTADVPRGTRDGCHAEAGAAAAAMANGAGTGSRAWAFAWIVCGYAPKGRNACFRVRPCAGQSPRLPTRTCPGGAATSQPPGSGADGLWTARRPCRAGARQGVGCRPRLSNADRGRIRRASRRRGAAPVGRFRRAAPSGDLQRAAIGAAAGGPDWASNCRM